MNPDSEESKQHEAEYLYEDFEEFDIIKSIGWIQKEVIRRADIRPG